MTVNPPQIAPTCGSPQRQQNFSAWSRFMRSGLWLEVSEDGHTHFHAVVSFFHGGLSSMIRTRVNVIYENSSPTLALANLSVAGKYGHDGRFEIGTNRMLYAVSGELIIVTPDQLCIRMIPDLKMTINGY